MFWVAEIGLDRPGIGSFVRQLVAADMPEHVRVSFDIQLRVLARAFDYPTESADRERRTAHADEHERRLRFALEIAKRPESSPKWRELIGCRPESWTTTNYRRRFAEDRGLAFEVVPGGMTGVERL
jgi:hypothetical protein